MRYNEYMDVAKNPIRSEYLDKNIHANASEEIKKNGYVNLNNFFRPGLIDLFLREAFRLSKIRDRREFLMPGYETPRKLSVLGGKKILANSSLFSLLYFSSNVKEAVSNVTGEEIYPVFHEQEFMVINYLEEEGGTHGWHLDDPKYALVAILMSPDPDNGGYLEVIPQWKKFCLENGFDCTNDTDKATTRAKELGLIKQVEHNTGDVYLLDAAETLHRVAPINGMVSRVVINLAYNNSEEVTYGDTAHILYGNMEGL